MKYSKNYYVYILTNKPRGVFYVGVSNNVLSRSYIHKKKINTKSFTYKYNVDKLVHYEIYNDVLCAIEREKRLKKWKRKWKIELIEKNNPEWRDLFDMS